MYGLKLFQPIGVLLNDEVKSSTSLNFLQAPATPGNNDVVYSILYCPSPRQLTSIADSLVCVVVSQTLEFKQIELKEKLSRCEVKIYSLCRALEIEQKNTSEKIRSLDEIRMAVENELRSAGAEYEKAVADVLSLADGDINELKGYLAPPSKGSNCCSHCVGLASFLRLLKESIHTQEYLLHCSIGFIHSTCTHIYR